MNADKENSDSKMRRSRSNGDQFEQRETPQSALLNPPSFQLKGESDDFLQMKKKPEEEEEMQLKRSQEVENSASETSDSAAISEMESSFGRSFSNVNIHKDSSKAKDVGAAAFTQGADVHFAPGKYNPGTESGQRLMAHEFAHVVQQEKMNVSPTTTVNGMPVNDDQNLEREADLQAAEVVNGKKIKS